MTKRRCLLAGIGLVLLGLLLVFVIPPWRYAVFALFQGDSEPPNGRTGPSGWGMLNSSPLSGDDFVGKGTLTPGIDFCSFAAGSYIGGPVPHADFVFVVWGDCNGGAGGTNTVGKDGFKFRGYLQNQAGNRRIEFAGKTKDGKTGQATVEGKDYDLAEGTLFLISARRGYRVKQLKRDMTRFQDAEELFKVLSKNDPEVVAFFARAVALSPDGRWTAIAKDHVISVMESQTDKVVGECVAHKDTVTSLNFSSDSKLLASGSKDKLAILWAVPSGDIVKKFDVPSPIHHVEFSGEGKTLTVREAVSPTDRTLREFDLSSGKEVRVIRTTGG